MILLASIMKLKTSIERSIKPQLIVGVIVLLFGAVAIGVVAVDSGEEVVQETIMESAFDGVDGSLTLFAFDMIARDRMSLYNAESVAGVSFDDWLSSRSDTLPQTDAFNNHIHYRESEDGFVLWTKAKDGVANTDDDYIKTYKYEQTAGNL